MPAGGQAGTDRDQVGFRDVAADNVNRALGRRGRRRRPKRRPRLGAHADAERQADDDEQTGEDTLLTAHVTPHATARARSTSSSRCNNPHRLAIWIARPGRAFASRRSGPRWRSYTISTPR